jgi:hypothetical protein|tara:strand:+ start:323 stop:454 length:132 start_codon:yes stop_codon:yes gene_type:complete
VADQYLEYQVLTEQQAPLVLPAVAAAAALTVLVMAQAVAAEQE